MYGEHCFQLRHFVRLSEQPEIAEDWCYMDLGGMGEIGPCCALDNMGVEMVIQDPGEPGKDVLVRDTVLSILVHLACI